VQMYSLPSHQHTQWQENVFIFTLVPRWFKLVQTACVLVRMDVNLLNKVLSFSARVCSASNKHIFGIFGVMYYNQSPSLLHIFPLTRAIIKSLMRRHKMWGGRNKMAVVFEDTKQSKTDNMCKAIFSHLTPKSKVRNVTAALT